MRIRLLKWTSVMLPAMIFVLLTGCGMGEAGKGNGEEPGETDSVTESVEDGTAALPGHGMYDPDGA